ncbi:hypothetical protein EUGRSUZ_E00883 [Eucalyptus grandis]|uniref:Uncharacterized protein n=2 Tax=Eucalyptus grandis TaxID=71139 RepID=A0A059C271_EUCGR|nr:hypothetical protein EUGRSUZ_E00883 [Eucalyptus grandis]
MLIPWLIRERTPRMSSSFRRWWSEIAEANISTSITIMLSHVGLMFTYPLHCSFLLSGIIHLLHFMTRVESTLTRVKIFKTYIS